MWAWIAALLLPAALVATAGANPVRGAHIQVALVAEQAGVAPGSPVTVAVVLRPDPQWHVYWKNPGDTGLAPVVRWRLPEGARAGPIAWPAPERIPVPPLVNYGYSDAVLLAAEITPPPGLEPGDTLTLGAEVEWLVCRVECIPGEAALRLELPVVTGRPVPSAHAGDFARARARIPAQGAGWTGSYQVDGGQVQFRLEPPAGTPLPASGVLFPAALELVDHAAPQRWRPEGGVLRVRQAASPYLHGEPGPVEVVLRPAEGRPLALTLAPRAMPPGPAGAAPEPGGALAGLAPALALAAAGGLLLNLMPCVFPILSLKALALAGGGGRVRAEGAAYAAGVVASFLAVAGLLLALRAAGAQVGWGFQLQSPWLVALLAWLMFGLGLALSGLWAPGARWMGAGGRLAAAGGLPGAFATGVLAVVVASPCTAPFMGPALGYAVTRPAPEALAVFAALGLGMAAPFLALAAFPALARHLPRPGPWMETLKQVLAFPLYLTAVWLVWVLAHQAGPDGAALALTGMVVLGAMLWAQERWRGRASLLRGAVTMAGLAALLAILLAPPVAREAPQAEAVAGDPARPFDREAIAAEVDRGRTVLVNMTAAWCITCLVNERVALDTPAVRARLAAPDVIYMKGDWTRRDPAITAYLESWGRNGVPLYVVYAPGREPRLLPQVLTPALVLEALGPRAPPTQARPRAPAAAGSGPRPLRGRIAGACRASRRRQGPL